ncbi:MAG: succinyldiaminopimelate transaminase [Pseudonocardiaceae bacterium]
MSTDALLASPWDQLAQFRLRAAEHADGLIDLSVGTPIDPVPDVVKDALASAADTPGYPTTAGSARLRRAIADWLRRHVDGALPNVEVLPTVGSKELIGWLPTLLRLGPSDIVAIPELSYPTYEVGARMVGAQVRRCGTTEILAGALDDAPPALLWLNSPSNPSGEVCSDEQLVGVVEWARAHDCLIASDECYFGLGWQQSPSSVLDPGVRRGSFEGVLAVHSLSKRSNMAGYRAGFVAGDSAVLGRVTALRKQLGMMVPAPVQRAMAAALDDESHAAVQRGRYERRRDVLKKALQDAGFEIHHSQAGMYLWVTRGEDCWRSVGWFARRGILVAPGEFYGPAGSEHVRVGLTAPDDRVETAAARIVE